MGASERVTGKTSAPTSDAARSVGVVAACVASGGMIAQQVAGKAVRDALFLTQFHVHWLPTMMAAAAVLSLLTVLWLSRLISRHAPARVVPILFGANAFIFAGEWILNFTRPGMAAIAVYLHTAVFAPALISSFWSLMNERYDPHTAKAAVQRVASGGTLGGILGSLVAWRAASFIAVPAMLALLAGTSLVCTVGTLLLRAPKTQLAAKKERAAAAGVAKADRDSKEPGGEKEGVVLSPWKVFRDAPYLRTLSLLVAVGSITSSLLDYVFSVEATAVVGRGPALLSFFGLFWLVVSVFSFILQAAFGRIALEKLGIAVTVALLPGIVILGSAFGLAVPGLVSSSLLRGGEAVQRNSLFRSAYELLYTPLPEERKRATKTIIDVAFDRAGTVVGSGIIYAALHFASDHAALMLLVIGIGASFITLSCSRALDRGYVGALEESLELGAVSLDPNEVRDRATRRVMTNKTVAAADAVDPERLIEAIEDGAPSRRIQEHVQAKLSRLAAPTTNGANGAGQSKPSDVRDVVQAIEDLHSGDHARIGQRLGSKTAIEASLVPHVIPLLADNTLYPHVVRALALAAPEVTGQLIDALVSPKSAFVIRRRIPRVLSRCPTQRAALGLLIALNDERFEVRYECGRALLFVTEDNPEITISMDDVLAAVKLEVARSGVVWSAEVEFDEDDDERPALIDRLRRDRVRRGFEHVFDILSLKLDRKPLRLAFKALTEDDEAMRGTALEYLENILPAEIRDAVWPYVGEERPIKKARPATDIIVELMKGRSSLQPTG